MHAYLQTDKLDTYRQHLDCTTRVVDRDPLQLLPFVTAQSAGQSYKIWQLARVSCHGAASPFFKEFAARLYVETLGQTLKLASRPGVHVLQSFRCCLACA